MGEEAGSQAPGQPDLWAREQTSGARWGTMCWAFPTGPGSLAAQVLPKTEGRGADHPRGGPGPETAKYVLYL